MTSFEIGILMVILYLCVSGIINRICKCIEQVSANKYGFKEVNDDKSREETIRAGEEENPYL